MNWDKYYYDICNVVATNSKCLSRKIGAILVFDKSIISTGYNGPARGIPSCSERYKIDENLIHELNKRGILSKECDTNICPRYTMEFKSGEGLEFCISSHSERNCILNAARHGICTKDTTLYLNVNIPCSNCLTELINAGIKEIVCTDISYYDKMSKYLVENSNLKIRVFDFLVKETDMEKNVIEVEITYPELTIEEYLEFPLFSVKKEDLVNLENKTFQCRMTTDIPKAGICMLYDMDVTDIENVKSVVKLYWIKENK